ncbi:hypothetical protein BDW67DRAFT_119800 [Aspergillus spinulosporus]
MGCSDEGLGRFFCSPNLYTIAPDSRINCGFRDSRTGKRVLSNQRGYYFSQQIEFDGEKVVELGRE